MKKREKGAGVQLLGVVCCAAERSVPHLMGGGSADQGYQYRSAGGFLAGAAVILHCLI